MSKKPVSSYPPEFFDIWTLATKGELQIIFDRKGTATNFRQRLYTFRKRLEEESPAAAADFRLADLKIEERGDRFHLIAYVPEWKRQIREQAERTKDDASQEAALDAQAATLANLGFGLKPQ